MDAVSGGASVLTFVGLAVQSAKTLYEFLSALKDGPQTVEQAVHSLQRFQSTLQQLAGCRALREIPIGAAHDDIKSCSDDMQGFANKLAGLRISQDERRTGRYWKKCKMALNEKSLARMNVVLAAHASALTLRLSALQRHGNPTSKLTNRY